MRVQKDKERVLQGLREGIEQFQDNENIVGLLNLTIDFIERDLFTLEDLIGILETMNKAEATA